MRKQSKSPQQTWLAKKTYAGVEIYNSVVMISLSNRPNIGKVQEQKLKEVGITNAGELKNTGAENALLLIRNIDNTACFNMLCALEGAIRGIRWHDLPKERKQALRQFLYLKNIPLTPLKSYNHEKD